MEVTKLERSGLLVPTDPIMGKPPCAYLSTSGVLYEKPKCRGYTTISVLEFLKGLPWDEVTLGFVHALQPTWIRVTKGVETTDARCGRVTVHLDQNDRISGIKQEVEVAGGSGAEMNRRLRELQDQER